MIWYNTRFDRIQPPHVNKSYDNTHVDDPVHWENKLTPPQDVISLENNRPKEELNLANHQLVSVLNSST